MSQALSETKLMFLYATKIEIGEERYYLIWPSTSAEAATEFVAQHASIGLAVEIDPSAPTEIRLQVRYGRDTDDNWATALRDASRWQQEGWLDLEPIVRQVMERFSVPVDNTLTSRARRLSIALLNQLGQQPSEQSPTVILAGLGIAETALTQLMELPMSESVRGDLESLVAAISEIVEAARPILQRFE